MVYQRLTCSLLRKVCNSTQCVFMCIECIELTCYRLMLHSRLMLCSRLMSPSRSVSSSLSSSLILATSLIITLVDDLMFLAPTLVESEKQLYVFFLKKENGFWRKLERNKYTVHIFMQSNNYYNRWIIVSYESLLQIIKIF